MKLSDMISSYASNMKLRGKLKKRIKLDSGAILKKGTVSDLLIKKNDGTYHFEFQNDACTVSIDEIEIL